MGASRPPIDRSVDAIVRAVYGSLHEGADFGESLRPLASAFDAHICALHAEDIRGRHAGLQIFGAVGAGEFVEFNEAYSRQWAGKNLWVERGFPGMLAIGYQDGDAVVSERDLLASEYYRHFLRPLDIRHGLGMSVAEGGGPVVSLVTVNRARCAGPFSDEEMARVARLRPHLVNTYAICRRLGVLQDEAASLRARLDRVPIGILLLDGDGRIVDRNAEAVRLLAGHRSVVGERGGVLHFAPASHQARYQAALVRLRCSHPAPRPEAIVVGGEARAAAGALVLHLCALPAGTGQALHRRARVLAFLSELDRHAEGRFAEAMLRAALELTPMEATVVLALREHHDPLQVAVALGLALSTVRSHLKHAFRKTGTTRQGELLRLVDRVLSAAPS